MSFAYHLSSSIARHTTTTGQRERERERERERARKDQEARILKKRKLRDRLNSGSEETRRGIEKKVKTDRERERGRDRETGLEGERETKR